MGLLVRSSEVFIGLERLLATSLLVVIGLLMFFSFAPIPIYVLTLVLGLKPLNVIEGVGVIVKSFFCLMGYYAVYKVVTMSKYKLSIGKVVGAIILIALAKAIHSILNPIKILEIPLGKSIIIAYDVFTSLLVSISILILVIQALTVIPKRY